MKSMPSKRRKPRKKKVVINPSIIVTSVSNQSPAKEGLYEDDFSESKQTTPSDSTITVPSCSRASGLDDCGFDHNEQYLNGKQKSEDFRLSKPNSLAKKPSSLRLTSSPKLDSFDDIDTPTTASSSQTGDSISSNPAGGSGSRSSNSSPIKRSTSATSHWPRTSSYDQSVSTSTDGHSHLNGNFTSPNLLQMNGGPEMRVAYRADTSKLYLPLQKPSTKIDKKSMRKKKRSASWMQNVLSPSYKQKNDDFHKIFKQLPESERLIVDYTCALMKDILVQGRMYVSQNYVCFHSNILKWQTMVVMSFKDMAAVTKEKTVKLFPNAIQFQLKNRSKSTFTSFTQRDRAFQPIYRLWQNALLDKPMTPQELWNSVRLQYGHDLGCSDDDYLRPPNFDASPGFLDEDLVYEYGTTNKVKRRSAGKIRSVDSSRAIGRSNDVVVISPSVNSKSDKSSDVVDRSSQEDRSSTPASMEGDSLGEGICEQDGAMYDEDVNNNEPVEHAVGDLRVIYLARDFDVSVETMFQTIFGDECTFWSEYLLSRSSFDIILGKWEDGTGKDAEHKTKRLDYHLTLTNPLGPKSSRVDETQVWYKDTVRGRYAVDCSARTLGVPYADYFVTIMRYCLRKVTKTSCELRISAELKFLKKPWGLVKSFIEKNAISGLEENFVKLEKELEAYFARGAHLRNQVAEGKRPMNGFPPQLYSAHGEKINQQSQNSTDIAESPDISLVLDSASRHSTLHREKLVSAPTEIHASLPSYDHNNNNNVAKGTISKEKSADRKWFLSVIIFLFVLLLCSNYTLYQRLHTLEISHSHISSHPLEDIPTLTSNDVNNAANADSNSVVKGLNNLEVRLSRVEALVKTHVTRFNSRWEDWKSEWDIVQGTMHEILHKIKASGKS